MKRVSRSSVVGVERRAATLNGGTVDGRHFSGHAAVFGQRTAIGNPLQWGFYETVNRAAFNKTLSDGADVVFLADHDTSKPLARTSAGTLTLRAEDAGLFADAPALPDLSYANDLITNVQVGNVRGMSFGFQVVRDRWTSEPIETGDGQTGEVDVRELLEVRLIEVSTTAFPAYRGTDADVRCALQSRAARTGHSLAVPPAALVALSGELRAGAVLSAATLATLQQVLDYIATADDAVDAALPILSSLMGVANPDDDEDDDAAEGERSNRPDVSTGETSNQEVGRAPTLTVADMRRRAEAFAAMYGLK